MIRNAVWFGWLAILIYGVSGGAVYCEGAAQDAASRPPAPPAAGQIVRSPDETIEVSISVTGPLTYQVRVDGQPVITPAKLGLKLHDGTTFGRKVELVNATHQSRDETWENPFGKRRIVRDQHNQLHLLLRELSAEGRTFELVVRAFNDGVAIRYELLSQPGMREFVLEQELTEFAFPGDFVCYSGEQEKGFAGPQEWGYIFGRSANNLVRPGQRTFGPAERSVTTLNNRLWAK